MSLVLHPRAAPGNRLQVWVGAFGFTQPAPLRWFLDGLEVQAPQALRRLASAREGEMVAADEPRAFTGVYEFRQGIAPDTVYEVQVKAEVQPEQWSPPLRVRTLPSAVPVGHDRSFNVLLVSCFHLREDPRGFAGELVAQLPAAYRPHLSLLLGDQVYLDLPTLTDFRDRTAWLASKFEQDYIANWSGAPGYAQILDAAPSASVPDDHEYWNNFPHPSPVIQNSLTAGGRDRWRTAAKTLYEAFQLSQPGGFAQALEIDVPPLSFFLMDNRTFRNESRASTLPSGWLPQLRAWAARVKQRQWFGTVISGQSLFQEKVSDLQGMVADRHLANYGDYEPIMAVLMDLARAGRPLLSITGDVHFGRVIQAVEPSGARPTLYEVISSPSSLVTTVGKDQVAGLGNLLRGLFGKRDPWFRHGDAKAPPASLKLPQISTTLACTMIHPQKGNHVALLAFRVAGFGLELEVVFFPIYGDGRIVAEKTVKISLSPAA